jgi:acetylornithine deacetylase/succinyl-diaminopimelate desuccinylase-like protein
VVEEQHPACQALVAAYRSLFAKAPVVDKWTFSTNGIAIAGLAGIPCLGLGPGHEKEAHAPNESCPVDHLGAAAAFYAAFMARLNGK